MLKLHLEWRVDYLKESFNPLAGDQEYKWVDAELNHDTLIFQIYDTLAITFYVSIVVANLLPTREFFKTSNL